MARSRHPQSPTLRAGSVLALVLSAVASLAAGMAAPLRAAPLDIAQTPLYLFSGVDPAFIMAVDDSGSMQFETLFPGKNGQGCWGRDSYYQPYSFFHTTGSNSGELRSCTSDPEYFYLFPYSGYTSQYSPGRSIPPFDYLGFARSPAWNPSYYNPAVTYRPWRRADGTLYPNATPSAARVHPDQRNQTSGTNSTTFDLTTVRADTGESFTMATDMVIPAGVEYLGQESYNCGSTWWPRTCYRDVWKSSSSPISHTGSINLKYYPATFYLPEAQAAPTGYRTGNSYRPVINNACGAGCNLRRYEIKSANYTSTAAYNQAMQNFANWFQYYRNRRLSMIAAMTHSLAEVEGMRIGYFTINNTVNVDMRDMSDDTDVAGLYTQLLALPANGGTPNRGAVNHMGAQFKRTPTWNNANVPIQSACQVNAGMLFTDGYSNDSKPNVGNQDSAMGSPFRDGYSNTLADVATKYYLENLRTGSAWENKLPVDPQCHGTNPDKRLDCRDDPHMNFYGITLGAKGRIYGVEAGPTANPFANPPAWQDDINDDPAAVDSIWHAALNTRGKFINASTPADITAAMADVVAAVLDTARPAGGVAASGARRDGEFLAFVPEFDTRDWSGDVKAYEINANGTLGEQVWSAVEELPDWEDRNIKVVVPFGSGLSLQDFEADAFANSAAAERALGFPAGGIATRFGAGRTVDEVIDYLRGDQSLEQEAGPFRKRMRVMGDVINSQPEVLSPGSFGYTALPAAQGGGFSGSGSYGEFVTTTKRDRTPVMFVGANNGMLHAFDASREGGSELFAVVPNAVLSKTNLLVSPSYSHRYFVDASPIQADARIGGAWKTVLLAGLGGGGRSVLALDVTNPAASFGSSNFLWEFQHEDLGLTYGRPQIARLPDGNWYAIFGSGYNSDAHRAALFIVNLATGELATGADPIFVGSGSAADPNGLGSVVAIDTNFDLAVDTVYGGDYQGNLWKFDLSGTSAGSWTVANASSPLFTTEDAAGARQPITGSIDVTLHNRYGFMVFFGTGRYLLEEDGSEDPDPQVQTFYGVWDNLQDGTVERDDLQEQEVTSETLSGAGRVRVTTEYNVDWSEQRGWFMDLVVGNQDGVGERFIGEPRVELGRVIFTTFSPIGSQCEPGGRNWLYSLTALTGANEITLTPACTDCGAIALTPEGGSAPPATSPPIIADPGQDPGGETGGPDDPPCTGADCILPLPPSDCTPGVDVDCPLPASGAAYRTRECSMNLSVLLPEGLKAFSQISCGRQSWRQVD